MNKSEYINIHRISNAAPLDPSRKAMPAEAFASAIEEFLEGKFWGSIKVGRSVISAQPIMICAEYAAYFFKMLLTNVYGRCLLTLKIESDNKGLSMSISAEDKFQLSETEIRDLIRIARNAGFEILVDENLIYLKARFTATATIRRVYAVSIADGKRIMLSKLIEIFYQGELMSAEPEPRIPMRRPVEENNKKKK